jgi:hypothetical protein
MVLLRMILICLDAAAVTGSMQTHTSSPHAEQTELVVSEEELGAVARESQLVFEKVFTRIAAMQSEIDGLKDAKAAAEQREARLSERMEALAQACAAGDGEPSPSSVEARPDGGDREYWTKQCPEGTGFHLKGVQKCVPNPPPPPADPTVRDAPTHEEAPPPVDERPVETVEPVAANTEAEDEALLEPNPPPAALKSAELAGLGTKLGPARQLASTDPWAAIELYRDSLAAVGVGLPEADEIGVSATVPKRGVAPLRKMAVASALTQVLDEAAELYTASWQHSAALATLQLSHKIRRRVKPLGAVPAAEMALSAAGLASAYGRSLRYAEALATLRSIAPLEASLPPQAVAVLLKQEGSLHECASDFVSALQRHEEAAQALGHPSSGDPNDLGTHKGLATLLFESGYAYI